MNQKIFFFFLCLLTVKSYGQVSLLTTTEAEDFKVNQRFNLTFILEIRGDEYIQETPLQLPDFSKFNMIGTASDQNTYIDPSKNFVVNKIIYQVVLEPRQTGTVKIGSARVIVNGKIYRTDPFDIFIEAAEKKSVAGVKSRNDLYLNLEVEDRDVYENQPTLAVLKAYSSNFDNFRKVKNIQVPKQENVNFKPVSYVKSEIEAAGNISSQVIAVYMIFPNESGRVEVKPVSASVKNVASETKILSNRVKLNVKKLPAGAPAEYKNAVGKFSVAISANTTEKVEAEKPMSVTIKLSGEGNLGNIVLPNLKPSEDYVLYPGKIINHIKPGKTALSGEILANYLVIPKKKGALTVETEPFSFFSPEIGEYITLAPQFLTMNVMSHDEILDTQSTLEKVNEYTNTVLETVNSPVISTSKLKVKEKTTLNWNAIFTNAAIFLGAFLTLILFRNWRKKKSRSHKPQTVTKLSGSIAEKEKELRQVLRVGIDDYFSYLEKQLNDHNWAGFFKTFEEMDTEMRSRYFKSAEAEFRKFLENHKGSRIAEDYRILVQKIQVEKYSPLHQEENLHELYEEIVKVYTEINK